MCGICGFAGVDVAEPPLAPDALHAMTDAIVHRGPDHEGQRLLPGVALGMRRLSIIDLSSSHQPLANERGDVWTVFNGEIFNFRELRRELGAKGHALSTAGDTETIVHLYEELGTRFPQRLRGMFAIAVWEEASKRLVLTRDRMGVKPLYYTVTPLGIGFASEVKSLIAGGLLEPRLDPVAAELYLAYGYVPGPRTLFAGVVKLPPACTLVWEAGRLVSETEYWNPWDSEASWRAAGDDEAALLELLRASVRARMISDVPLGVVLSGGLDSSLITALMAEASSSPVKTFSIGFREDAAANELDDARAVAKRFGTDHHELLTSAAEHPSLLEEALWHLEEPITDLSFLGFLLLSRLAREHVKVALCGQAADELLAGYRKHAVARAADRLTRLPRPARGAIHIASGALSQASPLRRGLRAITTDDPADRLLEMSRVVLPRQRAELLAPDFAHTDPEDALRAVIRSRASERQLSILGETLYRDTKLALVDLMFLYFDKMSMAASLEVRVPFADHDVVSFCLQLPDDQRIRAGRGKDILRRVARGILDERTIQKRKRGFFRAATSSWLEVHRTGLVRDILLDGPARQRGIFDPVAIERLVGQSSGAARAQEPLLAALLLELWHRQFVDGVTAGDRLTRMAAAR